LASHHADQEFAASWNRGHITREEERVVEMWYDLISAMLLLILIIFAGNARKRSAEGKKRSTP